MMVLPLSPVRRLAKAQYLPKTIPLEVHRIESHPLTPSQHGHEFEELVIITHGEGVHCVGNQRYRLRAGEVFVILQNSQHGYDEPKELGLINILFDQAALGVPRMDVGALPGYQTLFEVGPRVRGREAFRNRLRLGMKALDELLVLVTQMEGELHRERPGHQFAAVAYWMQIIAFLSRVDQGPEGERGSSGVVRVLSAMEQQVDRAWTVPELAALAGMSEAGLYREFQEVVGWPPIEHLLRLRVERAKRLLGNFRLRIGEVSELTGFGDSNYFTRQFRQHVGMSPREWRRLISHRHPMESDQEA